MADGHNLEKWKKSSYLPNRLIDFDQIWRDNAFGPSLDVKKYVFENLIRNYVFANTLIVVYKFICMYVCMLWCTF